MHCVIMHAMHERGAGLDAVERESFNMHAPNVAERALLAQQFLRIKHVPCLDGWVSDQEYSGS